MRRSLQVLTALSAAICSASLLSTVSAAGEELCSLAPESYASARSTNPKLATAISELEKHSIATWYSDRNGDYAATLSQLVKKCSADTRLSIVVYGLPNKDCEAGYSAGGGTVKNAADYLTFIKGLTSAVGNRKALYVLEPDAVGLLAKENGCGATNGYSDNLKVAIKELSANPNAEIYLDIGYWTLEYPDSTTRVTTVVKELAKAGTIKGITINTSNYRSNKQLATLCTNFQQSMGSGSTYTCIVDTSRNYNEPASTEWCNVRPAGIGHPPTSETGFANLDYFMWVKVPGESDGTCNDGSHNADAMKGPDAGKFFEEAFTLLWNQGYFVKEGGLSAIGGGSVAPTPASTTPAPATTAPKTPAPGTKAPKTPTPSSSTSPSVKPTSPPATVRPYEPSPAPATKTPGATTATPTKNPTPTKGSSPAPTTKPSSAPAPKPTKACRVRGARARK